MDLTFLKQIGQAIKNAVVNFVDADDDGKLTLGDLPRLIQKGQQVVALTQAGRELFGTSGAGAAKAADAFIDEAWETSRGDKPIIDEAKWELSKRQFSEAMYNRAAALKETPRAS